MKIGKFNPLNRSSITWKILLYFIIFIAIVLAFLWLSQVVFLEQNYKSIKIKEIENVAGKIKDNIDNPNLNVLAKQIAKSKDLSVVIFDSNGSLLATSGYNAISDRILLGMNNLQRMQYYKKALQGGGSYIERYERANEQIGNISAGQLEIAINHNAQKIENILYTMVVYKLDSDERVIMVNAPISPVGSTVETLRVQLFYTTVIMLVLAFILALLISKHISRPIVEINNSAKELAAGNYDTVFEGDSYKEIAELSQTLNYAAKELSTVENLRRELIANVSHDLRTPLTMITGYAEVMRDLPNETTSENIQIIIDEASRLSILVNDMMDISRLQSGSISLQKERFNITQSIKKIMQRYTKIMEQEGYDISFAYDQGVDVLADELRISQVVYNLINNAITYTGDDKKVLVRQICRLEKIRVEVIDHGAGIPQDQLEYIWDRYYKVEKVHKRAAIGTGLGLSIVKNILDMHGAAYGVESEPGQGSTFWFELTIIE
ncbi:MAG: sensor histidine kinase [Bacillota bacterium]